MYRFTQESDFSEWLIQEDKTPHEPWKSAEAHNFARVTILALSNDPDIIEQKDLKYSGPLMFDIDSDAKELDKALSSGVELCEKLMAMGVDERDLEINLSGSKGIHVYIDQRIFSSGRQTKNLPSIYKRMAIELYVPLIDLVVYSAGKGRMVRPPNSLRPDGAYKVPVTFQELKGVTAETYKTLVSSPALTTKVIDAPCTKAEPLARLFNSLKLNTENLGEKFETIPDEVLDKLEETIPPCVELLAEGKERDRTAFNRTALNLAKWGAKSKVDSIRMDSLLTRISEATTSKKYNTVLSRKRHVEGLIQYVKGNKNYGFSCVGMLSVVEGHPCSTCPLKDDNGIASQQDLTSMFNMFVYQNMGQYYTDPDFTKPIASFTMRMGKPIINEDDGKIDACEITINAQLGGDSYFIPDFSEEAWTSKQSFKQEIKGLKGVAFLGTDNDVAKLRLTITKDNIMSPGELDGRMKHSKVGLHYYRFKGSSDIRSPDHIARKVYVEEGYSVDDVGFLDSHILTSFVQGAPSLKKTSFVDSITDEANEAFSLLLRTNTKENISTLLGWFLATHLKQHFYQIERKFPLLYVSGMAGTGKNNLIAAWMRMSAVTGEDAEYTLEAPMSTKLPFQQGLSNTTTIPRVINEFNRKSVRASNFTEIEELLKAAFDSRDIAKGRLGGGDKGGANVSVVRWQITAPVITLSEEPISTPALLHRGIKVELNPKGIAQGQTAFFALEPTMDSLAGIGRRLIGAAMQADITDILAIYESVELPEEAEASNIPNRLKQGYRMLLASYTWAIGVFDMDNDTGLSEVNLTQIKEMKEELTNYLKEYHRHIERSSSTNEVDKVIKDFAVMANQEDNSHHKLIHSKHYVVDQGKLYLDVLMAYPKLKAYKRSVSEELALKTEEDFVASAKGLRYFISANSPCSFLIGSKGRGVVELDMEELLKANVPVTLFEDL